MGIALEAYRARIGLYSTSGKKLGSGTNCFHDGLQVKLGLFLPSLTLCLLLLISGIEPNPGPQFFKCNLCPANFSSYETIFNHHKEVHLSVPCFYEGCPFSTSSLQSYKSHCSRSHGAPSTQYKSDTTVKCPVSPCTVPARSCIKDHLEEHLNLGASFTCPYSATCKIVLRNVNSFRVHLSQVHKSTPPMNIVPSLPSSSEVHSAPPPVIVDSFPPNQIKDGIVKFYLELEGLKVIPSLTVQYISEKLSWLSEMSHHCLKKALNHELLSAGLGPGLIEKILWKTFSADPVFNVHHKGKDPDQLSTKYFRQAILKKKFAYVQPIDILLPRVSGQKRRVAQYVPLRRTLETILSDAKVKTKFLESFSRSEEDDIFGDFRDGSAFKQHLADNDNHQCIHLVFFMDAFEYEPFGPAKGLYKTNGMYYFIGNLPPEYRSQVHNIFLAFLIQEAFLKPTEDEYLSGKNKYVEAYGRLFKDLEDLFTDGILIDGKEYPVCFLFCSGDNLGAHQVGAFSQSFSAEYCCRFCPLSMPEFRNDPTKSVPLRSAKDYDESVALARTIWEEMKEKAMNLQRRKKELEAEKIAAGQEVKKKVGNTAVSKHYLEKLQSVNHNGVKPFPSALNNIPGFHVVNGLPPCLGHDLFEGVVDVILAKILQHFVETKQWFSMATLNRRIVQFKYKEKDLEDSPCALRSFDAIKSHAVETWTLLRLLPLIIGDLIQDTQDEFWLMYLQLKEICELICAPRIRKKQVAYLKSLLDLFLLVVKQLLPKCLIPKAHFLSDYPSLIYIYGPLIKLWTLRFESKHVFFKLVAKVCKSFQNITATLANKYQYRFVLDHMNGFLSQDVIYKSTPISLSLDNLTLDERNCLQNESNITEVKTTSEIIIKGTCYKTGLWMLLDKWETVDILAGQIASILVFPDDSVKFLLKTHVAQKCYHYGLYEITEGLIDVRTIKVQDLPDYYPLPDYAAQNKLYLSLKHSTTFMLV